MPKNKSQNIKEIDLRLIAFFSKTFLPFARFALFLIFFWFGLIKLLGLSSASPLAQALISKTIGMQYFDGLFYLLAAIECVIGILILFPKTTRIVIPLLLFHMVVVCSPLLLLPGYTWQQLGIPTLEGQYIMKNVAVVAVAIGIAASAQPLKQTS